MIINVLERSRAAAFCLFDILHCKFFFVDVTTCNFLITVCGIDHAKLGADLCFRFFLICF